MKGRCGAGPHRQEKHEKRTDLGQETFYFLKKLIMTIMMNPVPGVVIKR